MGSGPLRLKALAKAEYCARWEAVEAVRAEELTALTRPSLTVQLTPANTVMVSWPSPSTDFVLQQSPDLNPANWVNLPLTNSDNGTIESIIVPAGPGNRFYRLKR
jgi:hypothetical protein